MLQHYTAKRHTTPLHFQNLMPRPTLSDIATQLGISKMSVSRAMRGAPQISAELKKRVLQTAEAMGYRPDPEIAKLMTHMRRSKSASAGTTLAFVWAERDEESLKTFSWSQELFRGAQARAQKLGYQLEEFHLKTRGMTAKRLSEILEARGIPGFILSPLLTRSRGHVSMQWEKFSSVVIGLGYARPRLHRVHHHHFFGMMTALRMLKKQGYRRIGFYTGSTINERMYRAWSASFLAHHPLPLAEASALMMLSQKGHQSDFHQWIKTAKPEIIIEGGQQLRDWLPKKASVPLVTLGWRPDQPQTPGIDQQADVLGAAAVDLLVSQHQHNERGIPTHPKTLMTEGIWRPAPTSKTIR
jgi:LacI family transcriptional regulator